MNGSRIGVTAARRAEEQAALIRTFGGIPVFGPTVGLDATPNDDTLIADLGRVLTEGADIVVFLTGVGARRVIAAADAANLTEPLRELLARAEVICRGTKPRRALSAQNVRIDQSPEPAESRAVWSLLMQRDLRGVNIVIQCIEAGPDPIVETLVGRGARVRCLNPYVLETTADEAAAAALVEEAIEGRLDALTFTSAAAVHGLVAIAERRGISLEPLAQSPTCIVSVGPVTRAALMALGLRVDVEPSTPRMGAMYRELAAYLTRTTSG